MDCCLCFQLLIAISLLHFGHIVQDRNMGVFYSYREGFRLLIFKYQSLKKNFVQKVKKK